MKEWHVLQKERREFPPTIHEARGLSQSLAAIVLSVLLLGGGAVPARDASVLSGTLRHELVPLTQITPERGRDFLTQLRIGTVSRLPGTHTLVVTGDEVELQKALAVLELVDTRTEFGVRQLGPVSPALPSNAEIARAVGGVLIGTFANPPKDRTRMRAIVDVHQGNVVVIAPAIQLQDIRVAVELGPEVLRGRKALSQASQATAAPTIPAAAMLESAMQAQTDLIDSSEPNRLTLTEEMQERLDQIRLREAEIPHLTNQGQEPSPMSIDGPGAGLQPGQRVPARPEHRITEPRIEPKPMTGFGLAEAAVPTRSSASFFDLSDLPNGDKIIEVNLPERMPVIQLLDLAGKYMNLNYIYDPQKVTGEVTLKLNGNLHGPMRVKDLYVLVEAALQYRDLVMTRHRGGNIVRIVPKVETMNNADPKLIGLPGQVLEAGDTVVTAVFTLEHIEASNAESLLQGMGLTVVPPTSIAESRTLIVTAYAHRMHRIEQLLQIVDRPGTPRKFRYRQLRYTMAKTLAEKVKALAEQLEGVTVTIGAPDTAAAVPSQQPGESDVAYRTRLAQQRAAQTAMRAAAAARGHTPQEPRLGVYLDADERTNRILMIGIENQLATVEGLVDALDVVQQDLRALQLYRMKFVDADEVARKLYELGVIGRTPEMAAAQRQAQGQGQRITPQAPGQPRAVQAAAMEAAMQTTTELTEEGLVGHPQIVVVESSNALLVNGTPEQHAKIAAIIEFVDSEMDLEEIPYRIYPLRNTSPEHLAEILERLIQESEMQDREGKIERVFTRRQEMITIVPDSDTYSLIVYANRKNQEWIASLVRQLDRRRPQVLIDVTLVEVTKSEAFNYDLNLIRGFPDLADPTTIATATAGAAISGAINALAVPSSQGAVQTGGGGFTGFYADRHVNALLQAMQAKNYGRVLAKPKILAYDNQPGVIRTADVTYVRKSSSIPITMPTAGTVTQPVETRVDYEPYEAGITLEITPHISEGDLLRLDINLERSDFRETENPQAPPNQTTSGINTVVTVPDGSTVILGGMIKLNQNRGGGKVPILGDIPIIGGLFRSISNADVQSKLYVFVKAEIIRPPVDDEDDRMRDLEQISERNRMAFERHELEFQEHQNWPGVRPRPVDPPKVLDAQ